MKKIGIYFSELIFKHYSSNGDVGYVSRSGFIQDFLTVVTMVICWVIVGDLFKEDFAWSFTGIAIFYLIGRCISVLITAILSQKITYNQKNRMMGAGFWLLLPYALIFILSLFGGNVDKDYQDFDTNWEGYKPSLFD